MSTTKVFSKRLSFRYSLLLSPEGLGQSDLGEGCLSLALGTVETL
jgi:hypothetical protein